MRVSLRTSPPLGFLAAWLPACGDGSTTPGGASGDALLDPPAISAALDCVIAKNALEGCEAPINACNAR